MGSMQVGRLDAVRPAGPSSANVQTIANPDFAGECEDVALHRVSEAVARRLQPTRKDSSRRSADD
jgi:hypothetical protein